jgi:hypothetical protein
MSWVYFGSNDTIISPLHNMFAKWFERGIAISNKDVPPTGRAELWLVIT